MGRICFFDLETDSVKTGSAQIVQIAAVSVDADYREAHDALSDVRTTVALMRTFRDIFTAKAAA